MSLPDINFENIRPVNGSRRDGFEELCCQLASLEPAPDRAKFYRKGRGADAGVECFRKFADGTETGWQAKYLFGWDDSCASQLNKSIAAALKNHPHLTGYVVCLPFDLPDSRSGSRKSALRKWEDWRNKWIKTSKNQSRNLTITLWGKSELSELLTRNDPVYAGRTLYWFDTDSLTSAWFREQFGKARDSLGSRYTPETHIELPIRQNLIAFARHPELQNRIDRWYSRLSENARLAVNAVRDIRAGSTDAHSSPLASAVHAITALLDNEPIRPEQPYPIDAWSSAASNCLKIARKALVWALSLQPSKPGDMGIEPERWARHTLHDLMVVLQEITDACSSDLWRLANAKAVLLKGPAGIGKSHLLADIVDHDIEEGRPAALLLGGAFVDGEPWPQIRAQLDRPPAEQFKHFLGALDAAAQAAGVRAIVYIDALNERNGIDVWPDRLAAFLKAFEPFPRVGVVLSCRSTYVPYVIPEGLDNDKLLHLEHEGFASDDGMAVKKYLDLRGIVRPGAPNILPEFQNPLFLKTCCDSLERKGENELPKGLRGVTSIFAFYNTAAVESLNRSMKLDPHQEIVPKAISGFAQLLVDTGRGHATKRNVVDQFESLRPSGGELGKSLLVQLQNEGLLTVELMRQDDGSSSEMVRFTFERYSDHAIARRLFDEHLDTTAITASFQTGQPLHEFAFGPPNHERAGVVEAMAIQLPERTTIEILDVHPDATASPVVCRAFMASLLWREQRFFLDRTFELVQRLLPPDEVDDLLITVATEPANKFNALYSHQRLIHMTMIERDSYWSIYLADHGFDGPVETLISWATQSGHDEVDQDRAHLATMMLAWFLTTSHREIRDKATKALASMLSWRLWLGARLLNEFAGVNDLYVQERLLSACYGAALQGLPNAGLRELAVATFNTVFVDGRPPQNALLRDHARSLLEYAARRGVLDKSIDLDLVRPPYRSPWPIEQVPNRLIETFTQKLGQDQYHDDIAGSAVYDGDFARYIVDNIIDKWSPSQLGTISLPTALDTCMQWLTEFSASASAAQMELFSAYTSAAKHSISAHHHQSSLEVDQMKNAELALQRSMTEGQWEDFRVRARERFLHPRHATWYPDHAAHFNAGWARRWICKRAHEIGWTSERFGHFEARHPGHDRYDHRVERIGKKYQWLALHELVARMADNLAFLGGHWEDDQGVPPMYEGARQVGLRDIDPSLLITETHYDGWAQWGRKWWVPFNPELRAVGPHERLVWLDSDIDVINSCALIDLLDPATDRRWLALESFSKWTGSGVRDGHKEMQRDTWFRLRCIVVQSASRDEVISSLQEKIILDGHSLPKIELPFDFYLGEFPWHPDMDNLDQQGPFLEWRPPPVPVLATVASYSCERSGYDYSIDHTIRVEIPAPWLANSLELLMESGRSPIFVNPDGRRVFFDPSVFEAGPSAALIDRDAFLQMLDQQDLSAIWVIGGEKSAYGGRRGNFGFGGRLSHTAIYYLQDGEFVRHVHNEWAHPERDQLREFFGTSDIPPGIVTKATS